MFNEFRQKIFVFELINLNLSTLEKEKIFKAYLNLEDFEIQDHWSHGGYMVDPLHNRWPCLLEVKEDIKLDEDERNEIIPTENKEEVKNQQPDDEWLHGIYNHDYSIPMALNVKYESNHDFKECPFKLRIRGQKSLYVVIIVPLLNEIQRTLDNAFDDQDLDFNYFTEKFDEKYQNAKNVANQYAEAI